MMPRRQGLSSLGNLSTQPWKIPLHKKGQAPEIQEFGFGVRKTESNRQFEQVRPAGIERPATFFKKRKAGPESREL